MPRQAAAKSPVDHQPGDAPAPNRATASARRAARDLQHDLAAAVAGGALDGWAHERDPERWSPRRTLAFILVTCSAFWIAVGLLVSRLI